MKRSITTNLTILFILILLVAGPFLIMFAAAVTAQALGCEMGGGSMPPGFCGLLYTITFVLGWSLIAIVPITVGLLLLYLAGVGIYFFFSVLRAAFSRQPLSPAAKGVAVSTLGLVLPVGLIAGAVFAYNWFQTDYIGRCEALPGQLANTGEQNGLLAMAVKIPADSEIESRTILVLSPEGELLFQLDKSFLGRSPAWSPDGEVLAFASQNRETYKYSLHYLDLRWTITPPVLENQTSIEDISWTPDGASLLFDGNSPQLFSELFFVSVTGGDLRQLTNARGSDDDAHISPDGTQIVYTSMQGGGRDIYLMNIDGTNVRRLTQNPADDRNPAWSPDGNWIVFSSSRGGSIGARNNYDLYIMATDGSNQCQLTQGTDTEWEPVWSPDGEWIAYSSLKERSVYMVRPDGQETRPLPLPVQVEDIYSLDWAPRR